MQPDINEVEMENLEEEVLECEQCSGIVRKKDAIIKAKSHMKSKSDSSVKRKDAITCDKYLEQSVSSNRLCSAPTCKKSISLIKLQCDLCSKYFCTSHILPEAHGCGEAVKNAVLIPTKRTDETAHQLENELSKKLDETEDEEKSEEEEEAQVIDMTEDNLLTSCKVMDRETDNIEPGRPFFIYDFHPGVGEHILQGTRPTFKCSICEKTFVLTRSLLRHEKMHTIGAPYGCSYLIKVKRL